MSIGINKRIADRMFKDGLIDESDLMRAVEHARRKNMRVEEALVSLEIIDEQRLLKYVATMHKTQFVSTERMSRAKVDEGAIKQVPRGMAMHHGIFPLVLDRVNDKLIVATADPDNEQALRELKMAANVERVVAMVARPETVLAAIERGYNGDRSRFTKLLAHRVGAMNDVFDPSRDVDRGRSGRREGSDRGADWSDALLPAERSRARRGTGRPLTGEYAPPRRRTGDAHGHDDRRSAYGDDDRRSAYGDDDRYHAEDYDRSYDDDAYVDDGYGDYPPPRGRPTHDPFEEPPAPRRTARGHPRGDRYAAGAPRRPTGDGYPDAVAPPANGYPDPGYADRYREDPPGYPEAPYPDGYARGATPPPPPAPDGFSAGYGPAPFADPTPAALRAPAMPAVGAVPPQPKGGPPHRRSSMFPRPVAAFAPLSTRHAPQERSNEELFRSSGYMESLRVLVGLLENERRNLRGHSATVARLALDICERISLPDDHVRDVVLASYLHDFGKMGALHLTALNVAQSEAHLDSAMKLCKLPAQLMESVHLPERTTAAVSAMYERASGGGIPEGTPGKDIPIGARILAVADSYADLTRNPSNEYGRMLTADEAIDVLKQQAGMVFDANIVDVLVTATGGEKILTDLLANRHRVLIVDPDPEDTMVLQLRLAEQGFDVHVARTSEEATKAMAAREFALVVSEVDLDTPEGGFQLRQVAAQSNQSMSWVFVSSRDARDVVERALKLGVDDFIAKPVSTEILVAKLMALAEKKSERAAPRGVSGSLAQMSLTDIVQVLWHGRKTCALRISEGDLSGHIEFAEGRIVNAIWGEASGETAFYRMCALGPSGEFVVDPAFVPAGEPVITASPEGLLLEGMRLLDEGAIP